MWGRGEEFLVRGMHVASALNGAAASSERHEANDPLSHHHPADPTTTWGCAISSAYHGSIVEHKRPGAR